MNNNRITLDLLRGKVEYLNSITESPEYENQKYELCGAYGGWVLVISNDKNCIVKNVTGRYPKKELYYLICSYIDGMWDSDRFTG